MERKIKLFSLVTLIILLGFIREYFFMNINWIYLTLVNGRRNGALAEFHFLLEWSPAEINFLKTILTGVFALLFMGLTIWIINILFANKKFNKLILFAYVSLMLLALLIFIVGRLFGLSGALYGAVHSIMEIVQSFMPLMIFSVLFKYLNGSKQS